MVTDVWGSAVKGSAWMDMVAGEPWMEQGVCATVDPYLWHPDKGDSPAVRKAKAICRECPVVAACRDYSLERREMHGVWGALGERERRGMIAAQNRADKAAAA